MTAPKDQLQPHNVEAEQATLGAILVDPPALWTVMDTGLRPDHFFISRHRWVMDSLLDLERDGEPIDLLTVGDHLERRGLLADLGGRAYLSELVTSMPTALHVESYARIVLTTAQRRMLLGIASEIAQGATAEDQQLTGVIEAAESQIYNLAQLGGVPRRLTHIEDSAGHLFDRVARAQDEKEPASVSTGFVDLDNLLGGLYQGDLYLLAARPGIGKTALLGQLSLNAAHAGKRVLFFSAEMSSMQITSRLVAATGKVNGHAIRQGKLSDADWNKFVHALNTVSELPILIEDTPFLTPFQIRSMYRQASAVHGKIDLVIVDYLQFLSAGVKLDSRNYELGFIAKGLKSLAREMDVPVIAASQLSRGVEQRGDKRPLLSDLRDSGELEQDSDCVMFLYRDEVYNPDTALKNIADVIVAKHRNGPTGTASLFYEKVYSRFSNAEVYEYDLGNIKI